LFIEVREELLHDVVVDFGLEALRMTSQQCRSELLLYCFRSGGHVPGNHVLRAIDRYVDHPERRLRILLVG
jgi:hypothetical protein